MHKLEKATRKLRELISQDDQSPVNILFDEGVVMKLIECLSDSFDPFPNIQNEVLWICINIFANCDERVTHIARESKLS